MDQKPEMHINQVRIVSKYNGETILRVEMYKLCQRSGKVCLSCGIKAVLIFLNQACAWFLKIDPVQIVCMRVCVCMCVCVRVCVRP